MNDSHRERRSAHNHESTTGNPMTRACMLGVMAALTAAGTLFTTPAAQAQIRCNITNESVPPGWPFTKDVTGCTGTTKDNLIKMQGGLFAVVNAYQRGKGPVLQAMKPRVFLFNKPSDYATFIRGSSCPAFDGFNAGESVFGGSCSKTGNMPYTVVFENFLLGPRPPPLLLENQYIGLTAAHEMGHWFDRLILRTPNSPYSSSPIWMHEMMGTGKKGDYPTFNALRGKCLGPDHVFNGFIDNTFPSSYICNNNGMGPGLSQRYQSYASSTNIALLNAAVPKYYSDPKELFAEETAVDTRDVDEDNVDFYLIQNNGFNCTQILVQSMLLFGAPPGDPHSGFPVPINCPAK